MFNSTGAIDYLSIGDFDTAKVVSEEAQAKTTVGTPGYCSPVKRSK
jgi:serine/threonine protein kinase